MKRNWKFVLGFLLASAMAAAGSITVWGTNDVLTAAALNANFAHIHNTMVGGHGPRLVDADIASNANISISKLASGAHTLSNASGLVSCASGTCSTIVTPNLTVVRSSAGLYTITIPTLVWPAWSIQVTPVVNGAPIAFCQVGTQFAGANNFPVKCYKLLTGAAAGADLSLSAYDASFYINVYL